MRERSRESRTLTGGTNRAFTSAPDASGTYHPVAMGANGGSVSNATAINNLGSVVGWSDVATQFKNHAFVGTPEQRHRHAGRRTARRRASTTRGRSSVGRTIGTGWIQPANPQNSYDPSPAHAFSYKDGVMRDLGTLPGFADSVANAINDKGQIVGHVGTDSGGATFGGYSLMAGLYHAVLFDANTGKPTDLNDLLPKASGWVLADATSINDSGQILGNGTYNGVSESFLLTPSTGDVSAVPEPGTLAFAGLGILAVALVRRRVRAHVDGPSGDLVRYAASPGEVAEWSKAAVC